jgi:hypothetical protein
MDSVGAFLDSQPFIALFLVISLGYAAGKISIAGLSLGAGAVLFVGLAVGAIAPKAAPTGPLVTVGLCMFVYGLGLQFGRNPVRADGSTMRIRRAQIHEHLQEMGLTIPIPPRFKLSIVFVVGPLAKNLNFDGGS